MYARNLTLRLAHGPDKVQRDQLAKFELHGHQHG